MKYPKRLAQNLSVLRKHHPPLHSVLQPVINGYPFDRSTDKPQSKQSHHAEESILSSLDAGMDFLYLIGLEDGLLLQRVSPVITRENRGILAIEPSLERFVSALCHSDLRDCFTNKRIFWAVGKNLENQIQDIFDSTLCHTANQPLLYMENSDQSDPHSSVSTSIANFIETERKKRKSALHGQLKQIPWTLRNKKRGRRIWCFEDLRDKARYTLIQHVLIRNLFYFLQKSGWTTELLTMREGCYYPPYYRIYRMVQFEPDILFLCNLHPAYEWCLGAELCRSLPIPKVIWFADDPVYGEHLLKRHHIEPDETCLTADYEWADPLLENGAENVQFMPGAATKIRRGRKRGSRVCDVVFVGQVRDHSSFFKNLSPAWQSYCRQVIEEKLRFPRKKVREVMAQFPAPADLEPDYLDELRQKILWDANTRFRLSVVQALSDYDIRIYGNDDWIKLLPAPLAKHCYRGVLSFKHLFEVYRNSRITLNIHSLQSYTCMNVRDFDVPAAGGFLISDWLPRANEVYKPGFTSDLPLNENTDHEVFFYRSLPDLRQLVAYFLEHDEQRQACIERARRRILSEHTYEKRAQWLSDLFKDLLER